ncbi:MAG: hypothetical protein HC902_04190 [Calothrix sp. SM1_5_4]|nr:hypothetical protein [Calothrix sp. SM1_5_4]
MSVILRPSQKAPRILFLSLLGALAFNLSGEPGARRDVSGFMELSSNDGASDCGSGALEDNVRRTGEGACVVKINTSGGRVTSHVKVRLEDTEEIDMSQPGRVMKPGGKRLVVDMDLEAECRNGCPSGVRSETRQHIRNVSDLQKIGTIAIEQSRRHAQDLAKQVKEERERQAKLERCEITEDGEKRSRRERMDCMMEKLEGLEEEKAADYFDANIKDQLQEMLTQGTPAERALASGLLTKLAAGQHGNKYIQAASSELFAFSKYLQKEQELALQIAQFGERDPRRRQLVSELRSLKSGYGAYFKMRGMQIQSPQSGLDPDFVGRLQGDLTEYQTELDNKYAEISAQHKDLITGQNPVNGGSIVTGDPNNPRLLRGRPSTSYQNAPGTMPGNAWPAAGGVQPQRGALPSMGTGQLPAGGGAPGFGKPRPEHRC